MSLAVEELHGHVDHGITREPAALGGLFAAVGHRLDELARDRLSLERALEGEARPGFARLHHQLHHGEVAGTAGLLDVAALDAHAARDGLLVGHLGLAHVGVHAELAKQAIRDDLEMQLTHARDQGLSRLLVDRALERGIFLGQPLQRLGQLVHVGLGLGLDGDGDDGLGEVQRLENHGLLGIAKGLPGADLLETHHGGDVARGDVLDLLALVGVHAQQAPQSLLAARGGVDQLLAGLGPARIHADVGEVTDVLVGHQLEHERAEGLVVVGLAQHRFLGLRVHALNRRHVERRRQVVDDGVEQRLHALVLERRPAQHRNELQPQGGRAQRLAQVIGGNVFPIEVAGGDLVVAVGDRLHHRLAARGGRGR